MDVAECQLVSWQRLLSPGSGMWSAADSGSAAKCPGDDTQLPLLSSRRKLIDSCLRSKRGFFFFLSESAEKDVIPSESPLSCLDTIKDKASQRDAGTAVKILPTFMSSRVVCSTSVWRRSGVFAFFSLHINKSKPEVALNAAATPAAARPRRVDVFMNCVHGDTLETGVVLVQTPNLGLSGEHWVVFVKINNIPVVFNIPV